MTNLTVVNSMIEKFEEWFTVEREGQNIYVICARAQSDIDLDYVVSLERVNVQHNNNAANFAVDAEIITDDQYENGEDAYVYRVEDLQNNEYKSTRAEALELLVEYVEIYVTAECEQLIDNLTDEGGSHEWINENVEGLPADANAKSAVEDCIISHLSEYEDYSMAFTRYIVSENQKFVNSIVNEVQRDHALNEVMTAAEVETEYGLFSGQVRQDISRGRLQARKSSDRTWLIWRKDAEALYETTPATIANERKAWLDSLPEPLRALSPLRGTGTPPPVGETNEERQTPANTSNVRVTTTVTEEYGHIVKRVRTLGWTGSTNHDELKITVW